MLAACPRSLPLLLSLLLIALLPSGASPASLELSPLAAQSLPPLGRTAAAAPAAAAAANPNATSPPPPLDAFDITASMERARPPPPRPAFSNKTGCLLAERPSASALAAARDGAWTLMGRPIQECCDELDCDTPGTPQHPGNCDLKIKCGAPCPAEPVDGFSSANLNPLGAFDVRESGQKRGGARPRAAPSRPHPPFPLPPLSLLPPDLPQARAAGPAVRVHVPLRLQVPQRPHTLGV